MSTDTRIVYGATCSWWDSIANVSTKPSGLPCCPHCGGVLLELPSEAEWWEAVDAHDRTHPGYRAFIEWSRGRCHPNYQAALNAYAARPVP